MSLNPPYDSLLSVSGYANLMDAARRVSQLVGKCHFLMPIAAQVLTYESGRYTQESTNTWILLRDTLILAHFTSPTLVIACLQAQVSITEVLDILS